MVSDTNVFDNLKMKQARAKISHNEQFQGCTQWKQTKGSLRNNSHVLQNVSSGLAASKLFPQGFLRR